MTVKVILWGSGESSKKSEIKREQIGCDAKLYEKAGSFLIEYHVVQSEDFKVLKNELRKQQHRLVLIVVESLKQEKRIFLEELRHQGCHFHLIVKEEPVCELGMLKGKADPWIHMPDYNKEEMQEMLPLLLARVSESELPWVLEERAGSVLLSGKMKEEGCASAIMENLMSDWQYVEHCQELILHLYGKVQMDIEELCALEDAIREYIAAGARLQLIQEEDSQVEENSYYILEAF